MSIKGAHRIFVLVVFMLITSLSVARGDEPTPNIMCQDSTFRMDFRWDSSVIDLDYLNNRRAFKQLDLTIKSLKTQLVDSIVIITQASPEGVLEHNNALARRRGEAMRKYMNDKYPELSSLLVIRAEGESWSQLRNFVASDTILTSEERDRILRIIDNKTISIGTRKWRIGRDPKYGYLYRTYYPIIRNAGVCLIYVNGEPVTPVGLTDGPQPMMALRSTGLASRKSAEPAPQTEVSEQPLERIVEDNVLSTRRDTVLFAMKSNMLYDAITVLNAELEVPISRHFSLAVEYLFPWWESNNKYCLEYLELGFEGRYWFRNNVHKADRLGGHFLGIYGMSAMYDIQNDYDPAYQGELWSTGLTYGYAMRVGKHKRISLEFSLSVGYLSTGYRNYFPADDYSELYINKLNIGRLHYFGPTKLKVSLVVPINIGYNKKGGDR